MKHTFFTVLLIAILVAAAYFLGKHNGTASTATTFIQNIEMVKEIAELSSLEVTGTQKIILSNTDQENSYISKLKNYFFENTLEVVVPYKAKYGINMNDTVYNIKKINSDSVLIQLPGCKLQSFQLELDKLTTMNQAGLFTSASLEDLKNAQAVLYKKALGSLTNNSTLLQKAENNIKNILQKYYAQVGIKTGFEFR
ncbi:MAG: DUF4230 domain-containing protein [Lacibacter sp.]